MPSLSRWMIAYGLLLVGCDVLDSLGLARIGLEGRALLSGYAGGLLMLAAGLAAAQGRRSLRLTGLYVGMFLPLALAGVFCWSAAEQWRRVSVGTSPRGPAVALSALATLSILLVGIIARLRPREGIASRGYAVTIPTLRKSSAAANAGTGVAASVQEHPRRSEAG